MLSRGKFCRSITVTVKRRRRRKAVTTKVEPEEQKLKIVPKHEETSGEEEEDDDDDDDDDSESQGGEEVEQSESEEVELSESEESEEEEDEASKRDTLKELLEPFGKDQIIEFLKLAALEDPQLLTRITQSAESDPAHRKLFVHGLGWDATYDQVLSVFSQFGEVEDCKVVTDKATGRAKGFAFVLFKSRAAALKALKDRQMKIGNRMTSCQLASAGPVPTNPVPDSSGRKIFVANVGSHVNPELLRSFFAKFGELEEGPLGFDSVTGKFKGFAIFTYKTAEGCKRALDEPVKLFDKCRLECRRAVEGLKNNKNQQRISTNTSTGFAGVPQSDIVGSMNYNVGVNPAFYAANLNPAALMMGQNPSFGLANPMMVSSLNQTGLATSIGANPQSLGFSGNYGINTVSPSVIGSYASQAALQGLGSYQGSQPGNSSAGSAAAVAARPQSAGFGSTGQTYPSYFGH